MVVDYCKLEEVGGTGIVYILFLFTIYRIIGRRFQINLFTRIDDKDEVND